MANFDAGAAAQLAPVVRRTRKTQKRRAPQVTRKPARSARVDLQALGKEFRKGVAQVRGEIAQQEEKIERQGRDLARALVRQLRLSVHRQMEALGRRFAALEKQAQRLEQRLR